MSERRTLWQRFSPKCPLRVALVVMAIAFAHSEPCSGQYVFQTIDYPGAVETHAIGINNHGHVVGYYSQGAYHGYRYTAGTYDPLDYPGATETLVFGINDGGELVGEYNRVQTRPSHQGTSRNLHRHHRLANSVCLES